MQELKVKSPTFESNKPIPKKYSCDGNDINPPLIIEGTPKEAKTLTLIVDDPDAPSGTFDHWIVWNIPASTIKVGENTVPGKEGMNGARQLGYMGPCPPGATHRYFFKVYALDVELSLGINSRKKDVEKAMQGHILAKGELVGLYSR
ncbi:MAG: YbhB/YbcL family Raf kinase inhibitor-like protein [Candidatus Bathyarchaeia archaeon]|jgi:Raf kinase inhibitor-like YbhB/YbcL family protein